MTGGCKHRAAVTVLLACVAGCVSPLVCADGPPRNRARQLEPETEYGPSASEAYGTGYAFIERAARFEQDAAAARDARSRNEARAGAKLAYEDALRAMEEAVRHDPRMYEAHTYIGYARRKHGQHDRALAAYEAALELKPDYARAIEYQGEAFLGLDRFEQARFNYQRLYALDHEQANKLLNAMRRWAETRAREPGSVSRETIAAAREWLNAQPHPGGDTASIDTPW
ncbi:MAG: tetratricopeptide repeat protein [Gammaproteobacteria bacterium]|nr:hypothetical protein [Gammaproteobacteria bacterium]